MSSAFNPFIYSYMTEAFRTDLKLAYTNCFFSGMSRKEKHFIQTQPKTTKTTENTTQSQAKHVKIMPKDDEADKKVI